MDTLNNIMAWVSNQWDSLGVAVNTRLQNSLDFANEVAEGGNIVSSYLSHLAPNVAGWVSNIASGVFTDFLVSILAFFPNGGTLPTAFHTAATYFGESLATVNFIIPIDTVMELIFIVLLVKLAIWFYHLIRMGFNFARGIDTATYRWRS